VSLDKYFHYDTEQNVLVTSTRDIIHTKYSDRTNRTSDYHDWISGYLG